MKPYVTAICVILVLGNTAFSQKDYKAIILDSQTEEPIPYVNVAIEEERIGTVSDESGIFHLEINKETYQGHTILISCLGYKTKRILVDSMQMVFNEYPKILLEPMVYSLNEVTVTNKNSQYVNEALGYRNYGEKIFGYWKGDTGLGAELATKIRVRKGYRKLNSLEFEVWHSTADSVQVRINFYDVDSKNGGKPGTNLNKSNKNILYTIFKDTKISKIDLTPFDIHVENDFIVSLELLGMYGGDKMELILAGTFSRPDSFRRYVSLDKWERLSYSMAYFIESKALVEGTRLRRMEKKVLREQNSKQYISGFVLELGRPLADVKISNTGTKAIVETDDKGRYKIDANFGDILHFARAGFLEKSIQVENKPTLNVNLIRVIE